MTGRPWNAGMSIAAVLFLLVGIYLGVRVWTTVREVLSPAPAAALASAAGVSDKVETAGQRDELLASVTDPSRDPFHAPPRRWRPPPRVQPKPKSVALPVLRMILFDTIRPEVQLEVDGSNSGRLEVGSTFRGWTVVSISVKKVVVSKDGETHTLRLRSTP